MRTCSTARWLITGSAPGRPKHTGQTWVLGGAPSYAVEHAQNILDSVRSWQWTSIPMTASYRSRAELSAVALDVSIAIGEESRTSDRSSSVSVLRTGEILL